MAIFIDTLVVTSDANFSPETDLWQRIPPLVFSLETFQSEGFLTLDLSPGDYQCQAMNETELPVIEMHGEKSLLSNTIDLEIK